ncbi:MAG: hypothetical protein LBC74_10330 [Planctomycetaceae bacterium]|nr:hypothetical protein [Planctomycetaceae bacterium]
MVSYRLAKRSNIHRQPFAKSFFSQGYIGDSRFVLVYGWKFINCSHFKFRLHSPAYLSESRLLRS